MTIVTNDKEFLGQLATASRELSALSVIVANRVQERAGKKAMRPFRKELKAAAGTVPKRSGELRKARTWKLKSKIYKRTRGAFVGVGARVFKDRAKGDPNPGKYAHLVDQPFRHFTGPRGRRRFTGMAGDSRVFSDVWERSKSRIGREYVAAVHMQIEAEAKKMRAKTRGRR